MDIVAGILLGSFMSCTNKQLITTKGGYPRPQNVQDPVQDSDSDTEIEHDSYDDIPGSPNLDTLRHLVDQMEEKALEWETVEGDHAVPYDDIPPPPPGSPTLDPEQHHAVPYDDIPLPPTGPPTLVRSDAVQLQSDAS